MDWIAWLWSGEFRRFVLTHDLFIPLLFIARVVGVTALEWLLPARKVPYRTVLAMDIVGATLVGYLMIPVAHIPKREGRDPPDLSPSRGDLADRAAVCPVLCAGRFWSLLDSSALAPRARVENT